MKKRTLETRHVNGDRGDIVLQNQSRLSFRSACQFLPAPATATCLALCLLFTLPVADAADRPVPNGSANGAANAEHPLAPAIHYAKKIKAGLDDVKDFDATLSKMEVIRGRPISHTMQMKFRSKPFSVYLRFIKPNAGREVIYVDGRNNGNLLVHETGVKGLIGTIAVNPNSPQALAEGRFPITMSGLHNMVQGLIDQWERESRFGETDVKYYPNAKLGELECRVIETSHPVPRRQFEFSLTRLYVDKKTNLPVRVEQYGFPVQQGAPPPLMAVYTYSGIRTNVGLTDIDFDVRNPRYGFK